MKTQSPNAGRRSARPGGAGVLPVAAPTVPAVNLVMVLVSLLIAGTVTAAQPQPGQVERTEAAEPLATGWHDEMNPGATRRWTWSPPKGAADRSAPRRGVLRLRLGGRSESGQMPPATPGTVPRTYYWASAYRYFTVDLDRYPILAVRAVSLEGGDTSWWDAIVQEYTGGAGHGPETRASLANANVPGLLLFDVPAETGLTGRKQLRLRLNVAGLARGGSVDYSYVRFIRREDVARLREAPDRQDVVSSPPAMHQGQGQR